MGNRYSLELCFVDEKTGDILVSKPLNVHWSLGEEVYKTPDKNMINEVAAIIKSQVDVDIERGALVNLINELCEKVKED